MLRWHSNHTGCAVEMNCLDGMSLHFFLQHISGQKSSSPVRNSYAVDLAFLSVGGKAYGKHCQENSNTNESKSGNPAIHLSL